MMQKVERISLWSQSGPSLLLGAFAALLLKCAPHYIPMVLTAYLGYGAIRLFGKKGFALSLAALAIATGLLLRGPDALWPLLAALSIAFSWLLIYLGGEEKEDFFLGCAETIEDLEKQCADLTDELRKAKASLSVENKEMLENKERLTAQLAKAEKEREMLAEKCEALSQDLFASQRKEAAFQHALNDAQEQLLKLKNPPAPAIVPQEEDPEEAASLSQAQYRYATLREQFEEKSEALDAARKELFRVENELLVLQKETEEKSYQASEEEQLILKNLLETQEECDSLEAQVAYLQELISILLAPKKRASRSKKSEVTDVEDLIQDKIDQSVSI